MSKIKDKLYHFFVRRNVCIQREYEPFIDENKKKYGKCRLKRLWLLFKLNMHYRIFRKKTPMLKETVDRMVKNASVKPAVNTKPISMPAIRLPYLEGSESEGLKRRHQIYLARELMEYDIVSFDVFDTLIFRPFRDPKTLFIILGEELNIYNFYKIRCEAEKEARDENMIVNGNREVTLEEIYKKVSLRTGLDIQKGMKAEIELELKYCFANPYMKSVYKLLKEYGKKMIVCSDMYLGEDVITQILKKNGYCEFDEVFVSSEYHCSKSSGGLYQTILHKYPDKKIIHIGDNHASDYLKAMSLGIKSIYYKNVNEMGAPYRAEGMSALTSSLYDGIINTTLHNGFDIYDAKYEYGFIYGGLYVLGYVNYIHQMAKKNGVDKILFLARDGSIYSKVYEMFDDKIPYEYFHWSRIIGMRTTIDNEIYEFVQRFVYHKSGAVYKVTVGELLESLELYNLKSLLKTYKIKENELVCHENKQVLGRLFIENKALILKEYDKQIQLTYERIKMAVGKAKKIAIVDVGWAGSGPLGIKSIIQDKLKLNCQVECYLAASHHHIPELPTAFLMNENIYAYLFSQEYNRINYDSHSRTNNGLNNCFFEMFTQDTTPSFFGYDETGMHFDTPEVENYETIRLIHKGILDFAKIYLKHFGDKLYLLNISGYDAYLPFRMIKKNLKFIKTVFNDFCMSRGVLSDAKRQHIETLLDLIIQAKM